VEEMSAAEKEMARLQREAIIAKEAVKAAAKAEAEAQAAAAQADADMAIEEEQLKAALEAEKQQKLGTPSSMPAGLTQTGGLSQVRIYEQLMTMRQRMSVRLSESNRYARFLEAELDRRDEEVKVCQQRMRLLSTECKSLVKAADEAARVAEYGVDKVAIHATMAKLAERLANLEDVLGKDIEGLAKVSMVDVPVSWIGIAEEVKMMGSFDNWSRGVDLSPEDYTFSGEQTFSATVELLPGEYEVKFLVDGEWRLGQGWAMTGDDGYNPDVNNLLTVDWST